ncbi:MAG: GNAT family N-acetyltransferase [bacterium]|jgi:hypothetical protein|nr:GNAT family N-acetyltransferase [bacterium]
MGEGVSHSRTLALPDESDWRALLEEAPVASVYHTPEFFRALQLSGLPCRLVQVRRDGRLAGLAIVLLDRLFPVPLIGWKAFAPAGLLALDMDSRRELMRELDRLLPRHCLYFEQYVEGREQDDLMAGLGLRTDRHRNFLVDLEAPMDILRGAYSRGLRRNIRAGRSHGFAWRLARGPEELRGVHALLLETSRRVAAPPLPWPLLKAVYHELVPAGMCRIYLAGLPGGPPVNARVELLHGGRAIDWYTGTAAGWGDSQVGSWLVDCILEDLRERGIRLFDFGGAGRVGESYGPAEFKRRFGGREVEISRHLCLYHPRLTKVARFAWRLHRRQ